ncbi:hypothetical protein ABZ345_03310 [Lentzea sp. NPDC005914]|uniref:RCC1 domain-containing protein n=1 Tax=Lentzea sp. NPDC005914 TaxID=3154572 RepID=UPI0033CE4CAE
MRRLYLLIGVLALLGVHPVVAQAEPVASTIGDGYAFVPVAPRRVLDTRNGTGTGGKVEPVSSSVQLDLSAVLPDTAAAVVFNLTGTEPTTPTHIRVSPTDHNVPDISNLNLVAGETRANQVTVVLPEDRKIWLFNNAGAVHLIADLSGYYSIGNGAGFSSTTPTRLMDTRTTHLVPPSNYPDLDFTGVVPDYATSVTFNLTGTEPTAATHVAAYPSDYEGPGVSSLNLVPGQTASNLVTVKLGRNRRANLHNNAGGVHLIVDVVGYYGPGGHRFFPVTPVRAFDSRSSTGPFGPRWAMPVQLAPKIPANAAGAVLNLTGTNTTSPTHVIAYASGSTQPATSNLNLTPGRDTANSAVVRLGNDALMTLYNNAGSTDLIVDVAGFFAEPGPCVSGCVYGWGGNYSYGKTPSRRPWLSGMTAVDAGVNHAYALKSDGTVRSWGDNQYGQLGTGVTGDASYDPLRVTGLDGVTDVVAGDWSGYALKSDGTVWAWGWNDAGQLGTGTAGDSNVPLRVYGLTGVTAVAATHQNAYALKSDGTVWAWGSNVRDGLGGASCPEGQVCPPGTPLRVPVPLPGTTKITAIAAGGTETAYALRSDGTAWAWGRNWKGETGTGAPLQSSEPRPAQVAGLTGVVSIAGGDEVGYATTSDGKVWAWGDDYWGTLGTGTWCRKAEECRSSVPVEVQGLTGVTKIDSSTGTTFALKPDGSVWAWGRNADRGNLGNGTWDTCSTWPLTRTCRASSPVQTTISGVSDVAAAGMANFAIVDLPS